PLAWGKERVRPDAFLTGLAALSADLKTVTVTIDAFDAQDQRVKLLSFTVKVDRGVLADVGLCFALAPPKDTEITREKLDQLAVAAAGGGRTQASRLLELGVLVDGKARTFRAAAEQAGAVEVT